MNIRLKIPDLKPVCLATAPRHPAALSSFASIVHDNTVYLLSINGDLFAPVLSSCRWQGMG